MNELFWNATQEERKAGFYLKDATYYCLLCDQEVEDGYVFPLEGGFVDAKKKMMLHIEKDHGGVLNYLTRLEKKVSGLSEQQSGIVRLFYQGLSDHEVQKAMKIGSISTVRNHRATLKDKEKQAKTMATVFELLSEVTDDKKVKVKPHPTATMLDDRYDITEDEKDKVIEKYFLDGPEGKLTNFYVKEKHKIIILGQIVRHFEPVRRYREKEVDEILKEVYSEDYVLIRRYLIQYGFLDREKDGSFYWIKDAKEASDKKAKQTTGGKKATEQKQKALKKAYKEKVAKEVKESGVYQIRNMFNGKIYLGSAREISKLEGLTYQLNNRSFPNSKLQEDWNSLGESSFAIEILEKFEETGETSEVMKQLSDMKKDWKQKLQPYGDKGYHRNVR